MRSTTAMIAVSAGLLVFAGLAAFVESGASFSFDRAAVLALRSAADPTVIAGPSWFGPLMQEVTAFGGSPVLTLLTTLLGGYFVVGRKWGHLGLLIVVVLGQSIAVDQLKAFFDRPRPDVVPRLRELSTASFPSGHAASSASGYLMVALMLAPSLPSNAARVYAVFAAVVLALLVGMSRVALGVHYPTDVLAGWSFGVAWTAGWVVTARRLKWV